MSKGNLGRKGFISAYTHWGLSRFRGHEEVLITGLPLMACFAWFLLTPRTISPGVAPSAVTWGLSHKASTRGKCTADCVQAILWRHFLICGSLFPGTSSLCQVDIKHASTASINRKGKEDIGNYCSLEIYSVMSAGTSETESGVPTFAGLYTSV